VTQSCEVIVVGSGFAGSLLARVLAVLGYDVVLLERGTHPRFAIGESTTPLANLSLERLGIRYGLADCYGLATHGRWLANFPELRRGLKRGFTYYRHHPGQPLANRGFDTERLLVAASPSDAQSDTHWLRADVDHHFVREAVAAGVDYRHRVNLTTAEVMTNGVLVRGTRDGTPFTLRGGFLVDASGPNGFLARQLAIPSAVSRMETSSGLVFSHFDDVRLMRDVVPGMPDGPYPDDWAAVHHLIDEGWMYSLRFDDGVTSAGFLLHPRGAASLGTSSDDPRELWRALLERYPTIGRAFGDAEPLMPIAYLPRIQHRLTCAVGARWALMPHAYAFVDPLFSTGIAWGLRAVERLGLAFESAVHRGRVPDAATLDRYDAALGAEADQIDRVVAGAYEAMVHLDLFAAQAMLYFATVSFAEVSQRMAADTESAASKGFLGVGDPVLGPLPSESLARLRRITHTSGNVGTPGERDAFAQWIANAIAPRNIAGLADPTRRNLYPLDLDVLVDRHHLLGMSREQIVDALPALRGMSPEPVFAAYRSAVSG
jgi:tetracycline 7-halogenase / FADH2 O2-dependent halogenase